MRTPPQANGLSVSKEQLETLRLGYPVRIAVPKIEADVVMVLAMPAESIETVLEETLEDLRLQKGWAKLGAEAAAKWAAENEY